MRKTAYTPLALGVAAPTLGVVLLNSRISASDGLVVSAFLYFPILGMTIWTGVRAFEDADMPRIQKAFAVIGMIVAVSPLLLSLFVKSRAIIGPF